MEQNRYATKKHGDTECDPFWEMSDIKKIVDWFINNNEWNGYLITMFGLLLGRRISDTISLKWSDFYEENGRKKKIIDSVTEQKTGKIIKLSISDEVFEVIEEYLKHINTDPMKNYNQDIFSHPSKLEWERIEEKYFKDGKNTFSNVEHTAKEWKRIMEKDWSDKRIEEIEKKFKEQNGKKNRKFGTYEDIFDYIHYVVDKKDVNKWHSDWYRKKLKLAAKEVGIESEVSTHTLRKSFAFWLYMMHQFDPNCTNFIQKLFGHATLLQALTYMGVVKYRNKQYMKDHGEFIKNVLAGKGDEIIKNMPVVSLKSDSFGEIILSTIRSIQNGEDPTEVYQAAINMANERRVL